jgi:hypothetical protein
MLVLNLPTLGRDALRLWSLVAQALSGGFRFGPWVAKNRWRAGGAAGREVAIPLQLFIRIFDKWQTIS